ncbi:MAG: hypothetical protein CTY35_01815, partial [Methylotenera sp.]|uniref:hypothetical protein n=1 Tax=Methylotenera sp. TaxID=2051956 RepID=UPI000D4CD8AA
MTKELFSGFHEELIDRLKLDSGQCHLFAVELGKQLNQNYSIFIGIRLEYDNEAEEILSSFSHAVVDIDGVDYDCRGKGASERWESQWDESENIEFNWIRISNSPSIDEVLLAISSRNLSYVLPDHEHLEELRNAIAENVGAANNKRP